jgi:PPIC-type PPIASE domain
VKRLQVIIAALVVLVLVGGLSTYFALDAGATAYSVKNHTVSQSEIDGELHALADNVAFNRLIRQSNSTPLAATPGSITSSYTAGWLSLRIAQTFADEEVAKLGVRVTTTDRSNGESLAVQLLGSEQVVNSFPSSFRTALRGRFARMAALERVLLENPSPALLDAALAQCPSHRFVAHILVASLAAAQALKTQLDGGADFATLAAQNSTDSASAARGGDLGCLDSQQFVAGFQQVAQSQPVGVVSAPVQTQYGFHLIFVRDQPGGAELQSVALNEILALPRGAHVHVDPRYGIWDPRNGRVVAPVTPATTPTTAGATTPSS